MEAGGELGMNDLQTVSDTADQLVRKLAGPSSRQDGEAAKTEILVFGVLVFLPVIQFMLVPGKPVKRLHRQDGRRWEARNGSLAEFVHSSAAFLQAWRIHP